MNAKILSTGLVVLSTAFASVNASATTLSHSDHLAPQQAVVITTAPPVEVVEAPGPAPTARHFWIGGHWVWGGSRYVWERGRWETRRPGWEWGRGHWDRIRGGWHWTEGRWHRR
jgi:hypothetical protein